MANYNTLKTAIQSVIKTNGNNEITGALLQSSLLSMINSLGAGYQFVGVATPETTPGTPDQRVFYIAGPGTYSNFDWLEIPVGQIGVLTYDTSWDYELLEIPSDFINVNSLAVHPTAYANRAAAIADVPSSARKDGLVITYYLSSGWVVEQYIGASWTADNANWKDIAKHPVTVEDSGNDADFDLADESGNVLMRLKNGHIKTKYFDSENIDLEHPVDVGDSGNNADLDLTDENGNVLARFENGHFRTKNFDSKNVITQSEIDAINQSLLGLESKHFETCIVEASQIFSETGWTHTGFTITDKAVSSTANAILQSNRDFGQDRRKIQWIFKATANSVISIGTNYSDDRLASEIRFDYSAQEIRIMNKHNGTVAASFEFNLIANIIYAVEIYIDGRTFTLCLLQQISGKPSNVLTPVLSKKFVNPCYGYTTYNQWSYPYGTWKGHCYLQLISGGVEVLAFRHSLMHKNKPFIYLLGDSITEGFGVQDYEKYGEILRKQFGIDNVSLSGIGGETANRAVARVATEMAFVKPEFALVFLGTNNEDSTTFRNGYNAIVDTLKANSQKVIVCSIPSSSTRTAIVQDIATTKDVIFCDLDFLYEHQAEYYNDYDLNGTLYNDSIHPNGIGHNLMSAKICSTILNNM